MAEGRGTTTDLLSQHELGVSILVGTAILDLLLLNLDLLLLLSQLLVVGSFFLDQAVDGAGGNGERRRGGHPGGCGSVCCWGFACCKGGGPARVVIGERGMEEEIDRRVL